MEPADSTPAVDDDDVAAAARFGEVVSAIRQQISLAVVGQAKVIDELLISVFSGGHCLLQGVPGLAKTLLVQSLARAVDLSFARVQFTPDLMPSDVTGTDILQEDPDTGRRRFEFSAGPVFTNLLLADEINRAPPKTQAALLQAMQEKQVTLGNRTLDLPDPFFVLATQNPIEQEGTYPLPEAQLDRFMFMVLIDYPKRDEELEIYQRTARQTGPALQRVIGRDDLLRFQRLVRGVPVGQRALEFALGVVRATRPAEPDASDFVRHWLSWGAGPRAGQCLITAAKCRALMQGRLHATIEDIAAAAPAVLRHRIVPNFNAEAEGVTVEQIIHKILLLVPRGTGERLL
ncbi:MAG TPA: MoxR family ATPase [Tepidisphaeraceae bacterium]|jgi:MoxR-like ATPase